MKSPNIPHGPLTKLIRKLGVKLGNLHQYKPRALQPTGIPTIPQLNNPIKISIVTPSFEQGSYLEKTLNSVFNQAYPNLEYFVQDGGSRDNTLEILHRYKNKLSNWASIPDQGQSNAINLGFKHTTGEIMAWLNSDDLLLPGTLAFIADYFNSHPNIDVIYGNRLIIDDNDNEIGRWILPYHDANLLSWTDYIPQETLFWRRRIWDKTGGQIDESFRFAMDWDLLLRFRQAGAKFAHLPYFIGAFRVHEEQKTSSIMPTTGRMEINRIRQRELGKIPSRPSVCKAVLPFIIRHLAADMMYRLKIPFVRNEEIQFTP